MNRPESLSPKSARRPLRGPLALLGILGLVLTAWLAGQSEGGGKKQEPRHDPANAVANLEVYPGLQATLFASEPALTNPTNIDIDHRGRVWMCDVMNYRGNNGRRPAGDRILIFEDTDGDGKFDKVKTFYQARDIDSAMGICVLGNKVIVSATPNIFVFTYDDNDRILKKEVLFSRTGQPQHDHSAHTFVFGPDGKLYWNFGNTGQRVCDRNGKVIVDLAGNKVEDNGRPYYGGMVFRCDPDGSNFEVLAHNFRNNYEIAVDSFGTLWQSDNDDDGNRGVRINYVMEFGNYGYRDEMTGAGWSSPRTNMESETPLRHWHLNDPGVVPNLLQTGGGSPTGICVYEGKLLPKIFQNQVIHCDPGPSVMRAYPVTRDGAGYKATIVNILDGQKKNNWFRPVDPCVAPDGSLFVSDWYDPGVGGHAQRDLDRGRIFRVAPPGAKYTVPTYDYKTAAGAAEALKNPCLSIRYLAWTALHGMGKSAEPELLKLWQARADARLRARALWLLGRIDGRGQHYVELALKDADPDLRIVGLRLARELKLDLIPLVRQVVHDKSPAVRREAAIALRHSKSSEAPALWAQLAAERDGKDRWYLEALGIGADRQWDAYLDAYLKQAGTQVTSTAAGRDILWRSRADKTPGYLAKILSDTAVPTAELPRYFRAFDFQKPSPERDQALLKLAFSDQAGGADRQGLIALESIKRLRGLDLKKHPEYADALEKTLTRTRGTPTYIVLVSQFGLSKHYPDVLALAQKHADQQLGVNAIRTLLERGQGALLTKALQAKDEKQVLATLQALATAADDRTTPILLPLLKEKQRPVEERRQAVRALARSKNGAEALVNLARKDQLNEVLKQAAGAALSTAPWKGVKTAAAKLFPLPASKEGRPLPPFGELVRRRGDAKRGAEVFATAGTCANCHKVNGQGKDVGPDLSEIGKKLSREALLESILYPSAGISHNYETYVVELKNGGLQEGLLASQTPDAVALKAADGIVRTFPRTEIDRVRRSPVSLMPADLAKALTAQQLVDVLDYLQTLREAKATRR